MTAYRTPAGSAPAETEPLRNLVFERVEYLVHPFPYGKDACPKCGESRTWWFHRPYDAEYHVGRWVLHEGKEAGMGALRRRCPTCTFAWFVEGRDAP